MDRLRDALGGGPTLLVKRDDAIPFAFGGNKLRKLPYVIAEALAEGADTLITCGGVQSNHARATTAAAVKYGLTPVLVANGVAPERASANALLDQLMGAEVHYVTSREARVPAMAMLAESLKAASRKPYIVPLGASTPLGALGYVRAITEILEQGVRPDVIVHACSSGGTTAGLAAGCTLHGLNTRVIGVSADDPAAQVVDIVRRTIAGIGALLDVDGEDLARRATVEVDDTQVGEGYGIPTERSREAQRIAARKEAIFVDHTYTAKALGALIAWVREERFRASETVVFWHTGGQVGLFA
jgi:1-aminocyclopropane-1-carboxylate deaminase/D-cysteine desulfhydrase-like pyridoxal-dependent ACC family enzyme